MKKDELGKRMKEHYENRTRLFLPRRTYTLIRIDGKSFHTFAKDMVKPYDDNLIDFMNETGKFLCENIQGAKLAYVQSDEISVLLTDFEKITTYAWFDGNIQKICSVSSSIATAKFNQLYTRLKAGFETETEEWIDFSLCKLAFFDSRVFIIPDPTEVENYFIWRQKDAVRNSISMTAQSLYSHEELKTKNQRDMQDMIHAKGKNWNNMPAGFKRGRMITYEENQWAIKPSIDFLKERTKLTALIPRII